MFTITQEIIDQLKAAGRSTDYLEELLEKREFNKKFKPCPVDLFDETPINELVELSVKEVAQIQIFGRVLTNKELKTRPPHLVTLYIKEVETAQRDLACD